MQSTWNITHEIRSCFINWNSKLNKVPEIYTNIIYIYTYIYGHWGVYINCFLGGRIILKFGTENGCHTLFLSKISKWSVNRNGCLAWTKLELRLILEVFAIIKCRLWGIILLIHPANERWHYSITPSLIGWAHTENDPWNAITANRAKLSGSNTLVPV